MPFKSGYCYDATTAVTANRLHGFHVTAQIECNVTLYTYDPEIQQRMKHVSTEGWAEFQLSYVIPAEFFLDPTEVEVKR